MSWAAIRDLPPTPDLFDEHELPGALVGGAIRALPLAARCASREEFLTQSRLERDDLELQAFVKKMVTEGGADVPLDTYEVSMQRIINNTLDAISRLPSERETQ